MPVTASLPTGFRPAAARCLTPAGTPIECLLRIWWPADRSCFRRANRELRCDSGTAPPLYPSDEAGCDQAIAMARRKPCRSREGMQPAELGSQKTYQCSRACQPARAGRQARRCRRNPSPPVVRLFEIRSCKHSFRRGCALHLRASDPGAGLRTRRAGAMRLCCARTVWKRFLNSLT